MAGIAGIAVPGMREPVEKMLRKMAYRGPSCSKMIDGNGATLGAVWPEAQCVPTPESLHGQAAWDCSYPPLPTPEALLKGWEPFTIAAATPYSFFLARDPLGVRPLYYGYTPVENALCFASEVKALLEVTREVHEFPPGCWFDEHSGMQSYAQAGALPVMGQSYGQVAAELRLRLEQAVSRRIDQQEMGCWLSGGLDSSVIAALARPLVRELHSYAAGLPGAPDLEYASIAADFLHTKHHSVVVTLDEILSILPDVIYHLESFDALLVRSSTTNFLVGKRASDDISSAFSGEGGDELFAGYEYLKDLALDQIPGELVDITGRLHNTALQRVDRSAAAHGLVIHVPFLDPDVLSFAFRIAPELKLKRNGHVIEKWILREALRGTLPDEILMRPKAKFWQGSGLGDLLSAYAEEHITTADFQHQRTLPNGWRLSTKEELMYYRIFVEHFGEISDLSWMGRTKGRPVC